jgi:Protein of unknown function (DUF1592)/Protein of unknown function (DUF1588)/Protein of unknown function (DUF1595)/Protein of unknown function (DUF1585)/Protein of unknown function (DUF1587)
MQLIYCKKFCGLIISAIVVLGSVSPAVAASTPNTEQASTEIPTSLRLSPSQYKQTIWDIFGESIHVSGRFEPEQRDHGLLAIGARTTNLTDGGFQSYDEIAREVSEQVVDPRHRGGLIGCTPRSETGRDDSCARNFFSRVGTLLYRRPLTRDEINISVRAAGLGADKLLDFYAGIRLSLEGMLISPEFLLRFKKMEPDPANPGQERINAYSKATALSYFLWNTSPDQELLVAAKSGALNNQAGLEHQVDRLLSSPRVTNGIRAFFADMLGFSEFEHVSKEAAFFPNYTSTIKQHSQEQTLRTIVDHVVNQQGDYRDLFTTPNTFLTLDLASLYGVPLVDTTDNGQPQRWIKYTYENGDMRSGILSHASFTSLWSPSGRTSPTSRGKALRELILCQIVPPPPGNVEFKFIEDTSSAALKTTRERITAHRSEPMCAGCHKLTDPQGLALENFDSSGKIRVRENGVAIDASGEFDGVKFEGPFGFIQAVRNHRALTSCVAQRAFEYETGYTPPTNDPQWQKIQESFKAKNYNVLELLRQIAISELSYSSPPKTLAAAAR